MGSQVTPSNDSLIHRTRQVWQPRVGRDLSGEDARQIAENAIGFFAILAEWSRLDDHHHRNAAMPAAQRDSKSHTLRSKRLG